MPLVIVNPTKRNPANPAKKGRRKVATRKRRSPAQMRAFRKMISRNPYHKRRRRRNPAAMAAPILLNPRRRRLSSRRVVHRNPPYHHRRRRRNPSEGFIGGLMTKESLMGVASVVAIPTIMSLAAENLFPATTGYYNALAEMAVGLAASYIVHQFVDKQAGQISALVSIGTGLALAYQTMAESTPSVLSLGSAPLTQLGTKRLYPSPMGTMKNAQGMITMSGYVPSSGNNDGNMNGYATMGARRATVKRLGAPPREPGTYYF